MFYSIEQLLALAKERNIKISEVMIQEEMAMTKLSRDKIRQKMGCNLIVMEKAIEKGIRGVK